MKPSGIDGLRCRPSPELQTSIPLLSPERTAGGDGLRPESRQFQLAETAWNADDWEMRKNEISESELVWHYFGRMGEGVFVEVGANHPTKHNQTWFLETLGWAY
jgi:hypothetical protein